MRTRVLAGLCFCLILVGIGGDAQTPDRKDQPVWTMEFVEAKPEKLGLTLSYLDKHWMRERAEAKRLGAVLAYHRIREAPVMTPNSQTGDQNSIVLLTEYRNFAAYSARENLFDKINAGLPAGTAGVIEMPRAGLFWILETRLFVESPDESSSGLKLLAQR
jgi:hypothetical protein